MVYRFADCELNEHLYQLQRNGAPVPVEPKVFDVLAYLLQHRDRVVSKDELLDKLWPGQVVGENALTRCIRAARAAVGDDGTKQAIIETQHGRGYRFIAPLRFAPPAESRKSQVENHEDRETVTDNLTEQTKGERQEEESCPVFPSSLQSVASSLSEDLALSTQDLPFLTPVRPWTTKSLILIAIMLLAGIALTVHYLSRPTLSTQDSTLRTDAVSAPLPLPDKPSIAVLPFTNLSGDPEQEYFSNGISDDIITQLSKFSGLFVIARTSSFAYKGAAVDIRQVSRELGVRYILEGSVRKIMDHIRINVQLVDATTGHHVWSERYDRPFKEVFLLQDEITQAIVARLQVEVLAAEVVRVRRVPTENLTAYDFYLRGWEKAVRAYVETNREANAQGRQLFEQAIALDPHYALAYTGLGMTHFQDWYLRWSSDPAQSMQRAMELAQHAITLDDTLPHAHTSLGVLYMWQKQLPQAMAEAERAIALDPNFAEGYSILGNILIFAGRPQEAIELIEKAIRLNPRQVGFFLTALQIAYRDVGRYEDAIITARKVLAVNPNAVHLYFTLAFCFAELGRKEEAHAAVAKILQLQPAASLEWVQKTVPYANPADLERLVAGLRKAGLK